MSLSTLVAQEKTEQHKIVIIKKEIGENGEVIKKKIQLEGEEAKAYMKKMNLDEDVTEEDRVIKMIKEEDYEVEMEDENGNLKILKWNGEGEMPVEMKEIMEKEGMMDELSEGKTHSRIRVKKKNGSLEDVMDFEFDGKKAQLGVNIENHLQGVYISNVLKESSAAEGGLRKGDIITAVDGVTMKDVAGLIEKVGSYKALDKIKVDFLRDGKAETSAFVLKEKKELYKFKNWDEVMNMNNGKEEIEIEVEKEIMKEKK